MNLHSLNKILVAFNDLTEPEQIQALRIITQKLGCKDVDTNELPLDVTRFFGFVALNLDE